ncbi:hypothetical protein [Geminisphaera colitermitum]|uniref:hypothetical protein n=1 Tax=Geminisphaera colitermitum TaxID=1148786 RepID=UPI0001964DD2|nr:hypothetical protein [Geminisphaera colitermitum]
MVTHDEILDALKARGTWESQQQTYTKMRNEGLRRVNPPWKGAADMHFPLADMLVEKMKPFYVSQIFATDTVASFTGLDAASMAHQQAVSQWFDYQLKQRTDFETEVVIGSDYMLESGKVVFKAFWETSRKRLKIEAINRYDVIVPNWTGRLADCDWIVHVQRFSKHAFRRLVKRMAWTIDDDTINALAGQDATNTGAASAEQSKFQRQGITSPSKDDEIVLWEVYSRNDDGAWIIKTYSPVRPEQVLRPDFGLPYNQGVFADSLPPPPFFEISCELKDRGYYDSRGIVKRVAPFEASLCKDWNTVKDYQTLTSTPILTASARSDVGNNSTLRFQPGQVLPFPLSAVQMPTLPVDTQQGMLGTRQTAEQLVGVPDFGTGSQQPSGERKTAKEVSLIANVMGQSVDMRARIFRKELAHGLAIMWAILSQYAREELDYFVLDNLIQIPPEAFQGKYRIEPSASGDNWNRTLVLQKAQSRFQMFRNDPRINQDELYRGLLDADDPRLTARLLVNTGSQQAMQLEDQAQEIGIMLIGFPAEVRPTDDDVAHVQSIAGFVQRRLKTGERLSPETLVLLSQHTGQHLESLKQKNPQAWKQNGPKLQQFAQQLQQSATQAVQAAQMAAAQMGGMAPMPGAGGTPAPQPNAAPGAMPQPAPVPSPYDNPMAPPAGGGPLTM